MIKFSARLLLALFLPAFLICLMPARASAAGGRLSFSGVDLVEGTYEIYGVDGDGSNQAQLTDYAPNLAGYLGDIVWSPDGSQILYTLFDLGGNNLDLHIMDADGSNDTTITTPTAGVYNGYGGVSWVGGKILYMQLDSNNGHFNIRSVNSDGTDNVALTSSNNDTCPVWVNDDTIAFVSTRDGNNEVYTMGADGSNETNISNNAALDGVYLGVLCTLQPSPDGTSLVFSSKRDEPVSGSDLFTMDIDGGNVTKIFDQETGLTGLAKWSHDGTKIAFVTDDGDTNNVYTVNADGTDGQALTTDGNNGYRSGEGLFYGLDWSPDDTRLAFMSDGNADNPTIWTMNADGSDKTQVLDELLASNPKWQPAGGGDGEDLNGDGTPDSEQPNISGYISPITGKTVVIDVGEGCEITTDDIERESALEVTDSNYSYPHGLFEFAGDCGDPGFTTTVHLYYYDVDPDGFVFRKYNPNTSEYATLGAADLTNNYRWPRRYCRSLRYYRRRYA
jgi:Tol biopolymer transport system component